MPVWELILRTHSHVDASWIGLEGHVLAPFFLMYFIYIARGRSANTLWASVS